MTVEPGGTKEGDSAPNIFERFLVLGAVNLLFKYKLKDITRLAF